MDGKLGLGLDLDDILNQFGAGFGRKGSGGWLKLELMFRGGNLVWFVCEFG